MIKDLPFPLPPLLPKTAAVVLINARDLPRDLRRFEKDGLLTPEEVNQAFRLPGKEDGTLFLAGRLFLRGLCKREGCEARIMRGRFGKPYLRGRPFFFSLSRSRPFLLCAVSVTSPIGVDLEEEQSGRRLSEALSFFHPAEHREIICTDPERRTEALLRLWTRKEAFMKATGLGLHLPPTSFRVSTDEKKRDWLLKVEVSPEKHPDSKPPGFDLLSRDPLSWTTYDPDMPPGYHASLAAAEKDMRILMCSREPDPDRISAPEDWQKNSLGPENERYSLDVPRKKP
ncbi:MAG: 4'-phosphopantetheinyl transferase superfamily protein [Desulfovibrio sp.]|nr:4'-phosphopantetheinyl transferase superfamily protein [Desulfovibrio sp.]